MNYKGSNIQVWLHRKTHWRGQKKREISLTENRFTCQDKLKLVKWIKLEYIITANKMDSLFKCSIKVIPYFMIWERVVIEENTLDLEMLLWVSNTWTVLRNCFLWHMGNRGWIRKVNSNKEDLEKLCDRSLRIIPE